MTQHAVSFYMEVQYVKANHAGVEAVCVLWQTVRGRRPRTASKAAAVLLAEVPSLGPDGNAAHQAARESRSCLLGRHPRRGGLYSYLPPARESAINSPTHYREHISANHRLAIRDGGGWNNREIAPPRDAPRSGLDLEPLLAELCPASEANPFPSQDQEGTASQGYRDAAS